MTAASHDFEGEEDKDGIHGGIPPNTIKVEYEHTQEIVQVVELPGDRRDFAMEKERNGSQSEASEGYSLDTKGNRDSTHELC